MNKHMGEHVTDCDEACKKHVTLFKMNMSPWFPKLLPSCMSPRDSALTDFAFIGPTLNDVGFNH